MFVKASAVAELLYALTCGGNMFLSLDFVAAKYSLPSDTLLQSFHDTHGAMLEYVA